MPIETRYICSVDHDEYVYAEMHPDGDAVIVRIEGLPLLDADTTDAFAAELHRLAAEARGTDLNQPYIAHPGDMDSYRDPVREADGSGVVRGSQQGGAGDVTRPSGASAPPDLPTTGEAAA